MKKTIKAVELWQSGTIASDNSHIDSHIGRLTNCKIIPGESLTAVHRLLLMNYNVTPKKKIAEKRKPRIK